MKTPKIAAAWALIIFLLSVWSCKNSGSPEPEPFLSGRDARSADTTGLRGIEEYPRQILSVAHEKFLVEVYRFDSLQHTVMLRFLSEKMLGCGNSDLTVGLSWKENSSKEILIEDISIPTGCVPEYRVAGWTGLIQIHAEETPFKIRVGEKFFEGKLTLRENLLEIDWPDESQFKFTNKTIDL